MVCGGASHNDHPHPCCVGKTQLSITIIGVCGEGGRLTTIAPNLQASFEKMLLSCGSKAKIGPKPYAQGLIFF
jgi:hypothetical protein